MAVPGTGSTNQSLTFAASKKLAGKAHTSNLKEIYNETIPSNVQLSTDLIFGESIPQSVTTDTLYSTFSASVSDPVTVEYVEFYIEAISGTTYDANVGSFGEVGFGGGDEAQSSGPHGYQLRLTSSYESLSSGSWAGTGNYVNDKIIHQTNGALQLVNPSFGPQTGNNYGLQLYTGHPDDGGLQIPTTSPIEWSVDYFNGVLFVQDYKSTAVPRYARGFIYVGKTAKTLITEASSSGGGGGDDTEFQAAGSGIGSNGVFFSRTVVSSSQVINKSFHYIGISASSDITLTLPLANQTSNGQTFVFKDEAGNANSHNISIASPFGSTIDGRTSVRLESSYGALNVYSNGANKYFIY
jgi:hypothetical protein